MCSTITGTNDVANLDYGKMQQNVESRSPLPSDPMPKVYHKPVTYNKYTFEQKNEIAQYAIQHGPSKTARDFSLKWGLRMGESFCEVNCKAVQKETSTRTTVMDTKQ